MKNIESKILSEANVETLAMSIYKESKDMGFTSADYVKLMNSILGFSIEKVTDGMSTLEVPKEMDEVATDFPLKSKNVIIRKYEKTKDEVILKKWFEDDNSRLFLLSRTTSEDLVLESLSDDKSNSIGMITLLDGKPIGVLALLHIDEKNKKAEMRKLIGSSQYRGRGLAKEASKLWLAYGTKVLGLNKIYINTLEANISNISLNRQLGFKIEGVLKKECIINSQEHDVFRMAYYKE